MEIKFFPSTETPELLHSEGVNSVDVLIYIETLGEHEIGFFNYRTFKWLLISGDNTKIEICKKWQWRYFIDAIDKPKKINNVKK